MYLVSVLLSDTAGSGTDHTLSPPPPPPKNFSNPPDILNTQSRPPPVPPPPTTFTSPNPFPLGKEPKKPPRRGESPGPTPPDRAPRGTPPVAQFKPPPPLPPGQDTPDSSVGHSAAKIRRLQPAERPRIFDDPRSDLVNVTTAPGGQRRGVEV